ncbi:MAG: leucine-rich repeat domain-containing protein [Clostridia bacterium]|nr:leucine-rich repeat domain-containing protein [Clostridia bacterium]
MTMKRAALVIVIVVAALLLSFGALADQEGDYEYEILSDGTARVIKYSGVEADVTIPATLGGVRVSAIGYDAFSEIQAGTVVIPEGVEMIEEEAFSMCMALTRVDLPASLTAMGYNPFSWCGSLTDIRLAPGNQAFRMVDGALIRNSDDMLICMALSGSATSCRVPDGVKVIGENAFISYWELADVTLPEGLVELDDWSFGFCESLPGLYLPDGLQSIGAYAFCDATVLETLDIPSSVTYISPMAFDGCSALTLRVQPGSYAESWCRENGFAHELSGDGAASQTPAQTQAGSGMSGIGTAGQSSSVVGRDTDAPQNAETQAASGGTLSGSGASGVATAGQSSSVVGRDQDPGRAPADESSQSGDFTVSPLEDGSLAVTGYTGIARNVSVPAAIDGRGVTVIGENAFQGCAEIESVAVPEGVTRIEATAFYGCASLSDVSLPGSLKVIGRFAFAECGALRDVRLPEGMETLESCAFLNCENLVSVYLPSTLKSVAENPFALCDRLRYVDMGMSGNADFALMDGVLYDADFERLIVWPAAMIRLTADVAPAARVIGYAAFAFDPYLRGVNLPGGLEHIEDMAFIACRTLRNVDIPDGVKSIGYKAFANCYRLGSVSIPASVTYIGEDAFAESPNVSVVAPSGSYAESYCRARGIPVSQ